MTWAIPSKPKRYLRIFADPPGGGRRKGLVFHFSKKGLPSPPEDQFRREQWEVCSECHSYRSCYDYGFARMILHLVGREGTGHALSKDAENSINSTSAVVQAA
jgi:hypothetical protein